MKGSLESRLTKPKKTHFLDMDLYKLVNQCAIYTYYPEVGQCFSSIPVPSLSYSYT